jgi:hypothetical protein
LDEAAVMTSGIPSMRACTQPSSTGS